MRDLTPGRLEKSAVKAPFEAARPGRGQNTVLGGDPEVPAKRIRCCCLEADWAHSAATVWTPSSSQAPSLVECLM